MLHELLPMTTLSSCVGDQENVISTKTSQQILHSICGLHNTAKLVTLSWCFSRTSDFLLAE